MSFFDKLEEFKSFGFAEYFNSVNSHDIENSLGKTNLDKFDFLNLISNVATPYIEQMAQQANKLTIQYFGRVISLYAPLYISDYCNNSCQGRFETHTQKKYCRFLRKTFNSLDDRAC